MGNKKVHKNNICIIAGMPRSATTFLYYILPKHPSIFVPLRKETDYFTFNYYRGMDWYLNFYKGMFANRIGFDISPIYFMDKKSPKRILEFNPNIEVILIIRNPVDWILSFYKNIRATYYENLDFKDFLNGYIYRKDGKDLKLEFKNNSIKKNIINYRNIFADNLLLCDFRIFDQSPLPILKAIEKFVGIPRFFNNGNFENVKFHASDKESLQFVNILMKQKFFADLVPKIFPKKLIMFVRYQVQASTSKNIRLETKNKTDDENVKLAQEVFAEDVKFISELFKNSKVLSGNGVPFEYS